MKETESPRRTAIVTGASSGIGEAIAVALAGAGMGVALAARREDRLLRLAERIERDGGRALAHPVDVADLAGMRALARSTLEHLGTVDVLVNNAGVMPLSDLAEGRVEDWTRMVDVNVKGVLHGLAAVLPHMIERGSGHVVNIGSVAGRRPFPSASVYSATKFAVRALSWGMHLELGAAHGIRVTDIQPGYVETELLAGVPDPAVRSDFEARWEGRRPLRPEDVARAVLFAVTAPEHVSVSEILVRPLDQPT